MKNQMFYRDLAKYYDLMYSNKDYKKESLVLKNLISKYKKSKGKELLEVACGTGGYLKYLKKWYSCMGIDINEPMLKIARKNVKGVNFRKADMVKLNLNQYPLKGNTNFIIGGFSFYNSNLR